MLAELALHLKNRPNEAVPPMLARRVLAAVEALEAGAGTDDVLPEFTRCGRRDRALLQFAKLVAPGLPPWEQAHQVIFLADKMARDMRHREPNTAAELALASARQFGRVPASQWRVAKILSKGACSHFFVSTK